MTTIANSNQKDGAIVGSLVPYELKELKVTHERDISMTDCYKYYIFCCPNCDGSIIVATNEVNCSIFRHGTYTQGNTERRGKPISPHESKEVIDKLVDEGAILGCGKPFRIDVNNLKVFTCGYI